MITTHLPTAGLLVIKDRKLLLAFSRNKQCFYLPGGKIDPGESAPAALCREIAEELNIVITAEELIFYTHITAPAFGETKGIIMEQDCFFINRAIEPQAAAEISELKYFTLSQYLLETHQAPGAIMILEKLKAGNYID